MKGRIMKRVKVLDRLVLPPIRVLVTGIWKTWRALEHATPIEWLLLFTTMLTLAGVFVLLWTVSYLWGKT